MKAVQQSNFSAESSLHYLGNVKAEITGDLSNEGIYLFSKPIIFYIFVTYRVWKQIILINFVFIFYVNYLVNISDIYLLTCLLNVCATLVQLNLWSVSFFTYFLILIFFLIE